MIELLQGPFGGMVAGAFGMGAAAGYSFATRTTLMQAREALAKAEARIKDYEQRINDLTDRLIDTK